MSLRHIDSPVVSDCSARRQPVEAAPRHRRTPRPYALGTPALSELTRSGGLRLAALACALFVAALSGCEDTSNAQSAIDVPHVVEDIPAYDLPKAITPGDLQVCPGGVRCACTSDEDCAWGTPCLEAQDGTKRCATPCALGCDDAEACRALTVDDGGKLPIPFGDQWCVPKNGSQCDPCTTSSDCEVPGFDAAACIPYGGLGRFCGIPCQGNSDCAEGSVCEDVPSVDKGLVRQCVRKDGSAFAECACSVRAMAKSASTVCSNGGCNGSRACSEAGLSACSATVPAAETCNGLDDDCDGQTDEPSGIVALCDDGKPCTTDTCGGTSGCTHGDAEGQPCDADGSACTEGDSCQGGLCKAGNALVCDDGNPCTTDVCDKAKGCQLTFSAGPCDDKEACTKGETCKNGACQGGVWTQCNDNEPCTSDACDPATGACAFEPTSGGPCDDKSGCTYADTCAVGLCAGVTVDCDDGNGCTADSCKVGSGCAHLPQDGTACDDANACTSGDICVSGTCMGSPAQVCESVGPCVIAGCNTDSGACVLSVRPNGASCSDGDACTQTDVCASGLCAGVAKICNDGNPCTIDSCTALGGCVAVPTSEVCSDNNACTSGDNCGTGSCVGSPVVCDDNNPCTTDSCNGTVGCTFLNNANACNDGDTCTVGDSCVSGACQAGNDTCECRLNSDCTAKNDSDLCNGTLICKDNACVVDLATVITCDTSLDTACRQTSCEPSSGSCLPVDATSTTACDDGDTCTEGDHCDAGACISGPDTCGCHSDADCVAEEDGDACNGTLVCLDNACVVDSDTIVVCDTSSDGPCRQTACDPAQGVCLPHDVTPGEPCDDANLCTSSDACASGVCTGTAKICDDSNPCTNDACTPSTGDCAFTPNTQPCDDDDVCTDGDACGAGDCQPGSLKDCGDDNLCTNDLCDPVTGCSNPNNTAPCDDGNSCTSGDVCAGGSCQPGSLSCECEETSDCASKEDGNLCNGTLICQSNSCVVDPTTVKTCDTSTDSDCRTTACVPGTGLCEVTLAAESTACSDGNACTTGDACAGGTCAGTATVCNDNNVCTDDSCNTSTGNCEYAANSASCSDGDACTTGDHCANSACATTPLDCSDSNPCTDNGCDSATGCTLANNVTACDDGLACTHSDVCAGGTCAGTTTVCNDNNVCTDDSCNTTTGACVFLANSATCTDGDACTTGDHCANSVCATTPLDCSDSNPCTDNGCDSATGCTLANNVTACDDGLACTHSDVCAGGTCAGTATVCNDNNVCTDDSCNTSTGNCEYAANSATCTDGDACTTGDHCANSACATTPLDCSDSNPCTDNGCDSVTGCTLANNATACEDGDDCTSGDVCASGSCVSGSFTCDCHVTADCAALEDGDLCNGTLECVSNDCVVKSGTVVTCDSSSDTQCHKNLCTPGTGTCAMADVADGAACDDGVPCTDPDQCSSGNCASTPKVCNDSNPCTDDSCNPTTGVCVFANNTAPCNDGDACTQSDACASGTCVGSNPVVCTAQDQCHAVGTCNVATGVCSQPEKPLGTACNDGDACTQTDVCTSGVCTGGNPVTCSALDSCHDAGTCNSMTGVCTNPEKPDATPCNDGDACTQTDTCQGGACSGGNPVICPAPDQCHLAGTCNPSSGTCSNPAKANGTTCTDGDACTQTDTCQAGACTGSNAVVCTAMDDCHDVGTCNTVTGVCTQPAKTDGASCSDGNGCTTGDTCATGVCQGGSAVTCTAQDQCHDAGTCDPGSGACSHPAKTNNTVCNDGNACTQTDTCQSGACTGSNPVACTALDQCHDAGTCNTSTGVCSTPSKSNGTPCNDGTACTSADSCTGGVCGGTTVTCNDGLPCTDDICDATAGCQFVNNDAASCSDDNPCTDNDACSAGACAGTVRNCSDGDVCTDDDCDSGSGCTHSNLTGTSCDDGNACTTSDVCTAGLCGGSYAAESVSTVAGIGTQGGANGLATTVAQFDLPHSVVLIGADAYISDTASSKIRKLSGGAVNTTSGVLAGYLDGAMATARYWEPMGMAAYKNGIAIADTANQRIRYLNLSASTVSTLTGAAVEENFGDLERPGGYLDGAAASALFDSPVALAVRNTDDLIIADRDNHCVRYLTASTSTVSTLVGACGVLGTADGPVADARLEQPISLAFDGTDKLYIGQASGAIRVFSFTSSTVTSLTIDPAGTFTTGFGSIGGLAYWNDGSFAWLASSDSNGRVFITPLDSNPLLVGKNAWAGSTELAHVDGTPAQSRFVFPLGLAAAARDTLYVVDRDGFRLRKIQRPATFCTP